MDKPNNDNKKTSEHQTRMNETGTFKISGDWSAQAEVLKEKFPQLEDSDLHYEKGQEDALLTRIETKLNKHRGEVINIIRKGNTETA